MKKLTKLQWFAEIVHMELNEIKCHLCHGRQFEGGVELGSLKQFVSDYSGEKGKKDAYDFKNYAINKQERLESEYEEDSEAEEEADNDDEYDDVCSQQKTIDELRKAVGIVSVQNLNHIYEINAIKAKNLEFTNFIKKILENEKIDQCCISEAADLIGAYKI